MASLSRDELVTALRAHRNNDVYVIADVYEPTDNENTLGPMKPVRAAVTGVRYDPSSDCLLIDATEDYD